MMHFLIPDEWFSCPPEILVAGDGPYTEALALVLGTAALRLDALQAGPDLNETGGYPRVLGDMRAVVFVVPEEMSAAEALCHHQRLWDWVEKLTRGKDCHVVSFVFILGDVAPASFDRAIATGLAIDGVDLKKCGHAIWRRSGSLAYLTALVSEIVPKDLQALRGRRAADVQRKSLNALVQAAKSDADDDVWSAAFNAVAAAFLEKDYDLDLFCLPPYHRNGNRLREWLRSAVTEPVTPDIKSRGKELISLIRL